MRALVVGIATLLILSMFTGYREGWKTEVANRVFLNIQHTEATVTAKVAGYPTRPEMLTPNRFYRCEASIVDIRLTATNYFAVLREFSPEKDGSWKLTGTNRLLELPLALSQGTIYSVTHPADGGITYKAVDRVN